MSFLEVKHSSAQNPPPLIYDLSVCNIWGFMEETVLHVMFKM